MKRKQKIKLKILLKLQLRNEYLRIVISGGGTGGHIFPAIAIANALRNIEPSAELLFVGADGKMEMDKVPAAGYKIIGLPIAGIRRDMSAANLKFPLKLWRSLSKANIILKDFKPDAVVGVGGYASGPLLFMASRQRIPALIQEQNSYPGITNKILAKSARKICVAYEGLEKYFPASKIVFTGNPVRDDIRHLDGKRAEAAEFFGLDPHKQTILVTGGSQGARSINMAVLAGLNKIISADVQLLWQTGRLFYTTASEELKRIKHPLLKASEFITRMDLAYSLADIVVSRAGASTVSELCLVKKPSILVPLPTAAEDHQTKNCKALVQRKAALLVPDSNASAVLIDEALKLIKDEDLKEELIQNIAPLGRPDAALDIAHEVLKMISATI